MSEQKTYNIAYKCFYLNEGLLLVFEDIVPFKENEVHMGIIQNHLYVLLGNNIAYLSHRAFEHIKKTNKILIAVSPKEYYESSDIIYLIETDSIGLAKLEGALWAISQQNSQISQQNLQTSETDIN
jgi:hypothetical protein